jgi:undecaprenyl pyrophosphate phosphatase UppP
MRKIILFLLCAAMIAAGFYGIAFELVFAEHILYRLVIGAGMVAAFGGYLIWTDFVAPRLGVRTWED